MHEGEKGMERERERERERESFAITEANVNTRRTAPGEATHKTNTAVDKCVCAWTVQECVYVCVSVCALLSSVVRISVDYADLQLLAT